jgi:hypothetical protein
VDIHPIPIALIKGVYAAIKPELNIILTKFTAAEADAGFEALMSSRSAAIGIIALVKMLPLKKRITWKKSGLLVVSTVY